MSKSVVITGSTRGIGRGLAEQFLARGCRVTVSGRSEGSVESVVAELGRRFDAEQVTGMACDVTDFDQVQSLFDRGASAFGAVDVWINNAGISLPRLPLQDHGPDALESIVATNLLGLMYGNKVAIAGMKGQGQGQVWNMEGLGSDGRVVAGLTPYGCTKHAVRYLNKSLQKDVEGTGVHVNTLSPGMVVTDLLVGDVDFESKEWQQTKRIFNILADRLETVAPALVDRMLAADRPNSKVIWLTTGKVIWRFLLAGLRKPEDLFVEIEKNAKIGD